ncbi:MAG: recombinase family protein [Chloroflexota bacterium]|nr:recombinase family protein [Chloroflexota bacterium]
MASKQGRVAPAGATRAAIYCRVSSAGQEDNSSLETQEAACRAYAAERGWVVVKVCREVHTGAELFGRPQLTRLREVIRAGEADILLCHALDRLSRKQTHVAIVAEECESADGRLAFVTEDFEQGPVGTFIRGAKAFAAELEREKILERTMRGRRRRVEGGRPLPGLKPLYGYRWSDETRSRLELDPVTAAVVQRIFRDVAAGATIRAIARALAADGVPTPTGRVGLWGVSTVHDMLSNPAYAGKPLAFRTKTVRVGGKRHLINLPPEECIPLPEGTVPALIEWQTFEAIACRLAANKAEASRNNRDPEGTLLRAGFARCGYCGANLVVKHPRRKPPFYSCSTINRDRHGCPGFGISTHILDAAVWSRVEAVLRDPELIAAEAERRLEVDPFAGDLDALGRQIVEIRKCQANLTRIAAALEDPDASAPVVGELRALADQKRSLDAEHAALRQRRQAVEDDRNRLADVAEWCRRVAGNLPALTYQQRRDLLMALGVSVRVWREDGPQRWELTMAVQDVAAVHRGVPIVSTTS